MDLLLSKFLTILLTLGLLSAGAAPIAHRTATPAPIPTPPVTSVEKVIHYHLDGDIRTLDPGLVTAASEITGTKQLFEGLVRLTERGLVPGMAERWAVLDDGTKYIFHLRDGVRWSNGDPVTAEDFVYAWTRVLDPRLSSDFAYQLYDVKGAEEFNLSDPKDLVHYEATKKALGIKAVDSRTLEVTLTRPTPYFLHLTAFATLMPVPHQTVDQNRDWAEHPVTLVSNGPFKLQEWIAHRRAVFVKNPTYWNSAAVKVDKLVFEPIEDAGQALRSFEAGELDLMGAPPVTELPRLEKEGKAGYAPFLGTFFYVMNTTAKPFDDLRVRRALALALDPTAVRSVVPSANPAHALVPYGTPDAAPGSDFRSVGGDLFHQDIAEAKRLLAEAGYPDGFGFPEIDLLYSTNSIYKALAEVAVGQWRQNLNITVKPVNVEYKFLVDARRKGSFTLARSGWYGDYLDALTFLDLAKTGDMFNDSHYSNPEYDSLLRDARSIPDQPVRQAMMHKAESLLIRDMPVIPLYHYREIYLQSPKVTGVFRDPLGGIDFTFATIDN